MAKKLTSRTVYGKASNLKSWSCILLGVSRVIASTHCIYSIILPYHIFVGKNTALSATSLLCSDAKVQGQFYQAFRKTGSAHFWKAAFVLWPACMGLFDYNLHISSSQYLFHDSVLIFQARSESWFAHMSLPGLFSPFYSTNNHW